MAYNYTILCDHCPEYNDISFEKCSGCGNSIPGSINVKRAKIADEITALMDRYDSAKLELEGNNLTSEGNLLEKMVSSNGKAVINTRIEMLFELFCRGESYQGYRRLVGENKRPPAAFSNDIKRGVVEAALFGSTQDIIYGALSINETGLTSYGDFTMVMRTDTIKNWTTALECNSYNFIDMVRAKGWNENEPLPPGFLSTWPDNHMLAICKLFRRLKKNVELEELARLVLFTEGKRETDDFIELHIYGSLGAATVEKLRVEKDIKSKLDSKQVNQLIEVERKFEIEYF